MSERKIIYDPRVLYNPKTDTTAIYQFDCAIDGRRRWFCYDGKTVTRKFGKMKYPKGFVEVAWFYEGTLS